MPGLVPGIHSLWPCNSKDVDGRDIACESTPSFGRLCPAMTPRVWRARPFSRQSFIFNCQTAARAGMAARVKGVRHHPYCLARPRVGPSSRRLPSKMRGMARQGAQPLFLMCLHSLSEMRGAARRATRTSLRTSGVICGRLPYGAGPRFSWPPVKTRSGLRQPSSWRAAPIGRQAEPRRRIRSHPA
jgi:hypothetical protein